MQYWIPKAVLVGALMSASGCSLFINDAHHERNYRASEPVKVPANLDTPAADPEYKMEVAKYKNDDAEPNLRPPAQVLSVATGSWIDENDTEARVFFDKNDGINDLDEFVWQSIEATLAANNTEARAKNKLEGVIETEWYSLIVPEADWFWEDEKPVSKQRFKFVLEEKSHHRTTALSAHLVEFESESETLSPLLRQQLEVRALNQVIGEFDYRYRQLLTELQKQQGDLSLEIGFDSKGNAALIAKQNYQVVFERFSTALERMSFTLIEADAATGRIIADYVKPKDSVWDAIWGDEVMQLPLESGQYQLLVSTHKDGASITWTDPSGEALKPEVVSQLQQVLLDAVRERGIKL